MRHRWKAVGIGAISEEAAQEWAEAQQEMEPRIVGANERYNMDWYGSTCVVCGLNRADAEERCPGPPLDGTATKHLWHVVQECDFTPPDAWNEDEDGQGMPTWLDVLCRFCGQSADGAGPTCPERLFWLTGSQREWDISEIDALAPGSGERPSTREGE